MKNGIHGNREQLEELSVNRILGELYDKAKAENDGKIHISNDVDIDFSEEEKEILKKASEILNDLGARLWQNDCDEDGVFFSDLGGGIENALEGDYQMP